MSGYYDLLVCVRCHAYPALVLDTLDSILQFTGRGTTKVVCAVDGGNTKLAKVVSGLLGEESVFLSPHRCGWGAGLMELLLCSITWFSERMSFGHFMSCDYDTLFIKPGVDLEVLDYVVSPEVGLVGYYNADNLHWRTIFTTERDKVAAYVGGIPRTYQPGEGVQGGGFLLTQSCLSEMKRRGMFSPPWSTPKVFTTIADDHLITLYTRVCGLEVVPLSDKFHFRWRLGGDPLSFAEKDVVAFHPTKIRPEVKDPAVEKRVRNFYRNLRGREPLE
jgi:hypothetical protein